MHTECSCFSLFSLFGVRRVLHQDQRFDAVPFLTEDCEINACNINEGAHIMEKTLCKKKKCVHAVLLECQ